MPNPSAGNRRGSRILDCEPEDVIHARRCKKCGRYNCTCPPETHCRTCLQDLRDCICKFLPAERAALEVHPIDEMGLNPQMLGMMYVTAAGRFRRATA